MMALSPTLLIHEIAALAQENERLRAQLAADSLGSFGLPGPGATRRYLASLPAPVAVIGLDIRKMHELNLPTVLGYSGTTRMVAALLRGRAGGERPADWVGQWGGDEFVLVTAPGTGPGRLSRLVSDAARLTAQMGAEARRTLAAATGGLVDGLAVAAVLIDPARSPLVAAERAVGLACALKAAGAMTGSRATSGARGMILARVM